LGCSRNDWVWEKKRHYKYMNKPYGLKDWMENVLGMNNATRAAQVEDGIVMLLDPDMILLRPMVHDFRQEETIFVQNKPRTKVVKHGYPMAQQDGYLDNRWMYLNISHITAGKGNINHVAGSDGPILYNSGPPYLATVRDMYRIAVLWSEYAPRVYDVFPKLFAEMFGFIIATTQLDLPHTLIKSLVVSTTGTRSREGWKYIDALSNDEICSPPPDAPLPIGLHYCKRYLLDRSFFSKYRLKKNYISCESPMLEPPPADLATREHTKAYVPPPHGHNMEIKWDAPNRTFELWQSKRESFMLCALISKVNEAAMHFKKSNCGEDANMTFYSLFTDPNH